MATRRIGTASINDHQRDADNAKMREAYQDILTKAAPFFAPVSMPDGAMIEEIARIICPHACLEGTPRNNAPYRQQVFAEARAEAMTKARQIAALARPRAAVGEREACKECGGSSLFWFVHYHNRSQVVEGRLRTGDVECLFVLGCEECSATLRTATADEVAAILALQSPPAKVEGV